MVNLDLNCMPLRMTDSGFDSGPPSKKSKTSSPTSSITSFDPDTADLGLILTELSNVLSPELSDSISRLQSLDGVRKPDETIQNNQHLSALLGMNMPLARGQQVNSELQFLMNSPGLPASGMPTSRLPGSLLQQQQQPGTTVSWPQRQPMNYPPHRYPVLNPTGLEASPQVEVLTPVEFAPGLNGNFVNGQGFGAGFVRGTINPPARATYSGLTRIRMTSANESLLSRGQKVHGAPPSGVRTEFSDGERPADDRFLNGAYLVHSGELSTKQFGGGPTGAVSPLSSPLVNTRIGSVSDTNTLAPALDFSGPAMSSGVPCRTPLNVAVAETVPRSSASAARLPSDIRTNVQHSSTEKQRLIQQQLVLIFHAYKCHRREQANGVQHPPCPLPKCQSMKNVLRHMTSCTEGRLCRVPHCSSSSQIIGHWRNCTRLDCPICAPLKNGSLRRPLGVPSTAGGPASGAVALTDANPTYKGFSPKHATAVQPPPKASNSNATTHMSLASNALGSTFLRSLQSSLGGVEDVAPVPGQDWRMSVTQDLRNHLVHKLVQAIFPAHGSMALKDPRMSNLVCYAKKVEGDMYEKARSRENYYHLLAEKIYKIQKELEQKKLVKILDQNGMKSTTARAPLNDSSAAAAQGGNFQKTLPSSLIVSGETSRPSPSPVLLSPVSAASASFVDIAGLGASPTFSQPTVGDLLSQDQGNSLANMAAPSATTIQCRDRSRLMPFFTDTPWTNTGQVDVIAQNSFAVHHTDSKLQLANVLSKRCQEMDMLEKRQIKNEFSSPSSQVAGSFLETFPAAVVSIGASSCQPWEKSDKLELNMNIKQEMTFEPFFSPDNGMLSSELDSVSQSMGSHLSDSLFGYEPMSSSLTAEVKLDIKHEDITDDEMATKSESTEAPRETFDVSGRILKEIEFKTETESDEFTMLDCKKKTDVKPEIEVKMENEMESTMEEKIQKGLQDSGQTSSAELSKGPTENGQTNAPKQSLKAGKKVWTSEELKETFLPIIEKLSSIEPESIPFRCPVDPMALGIPDYFQIVKRPMDLSTIRSKLESGEYAGPWNAVDDVLLMFDNAWLYNRKTSKVYKYCSKLAEVFESEVDPVMRSLGFCCGRRYVFTPQVLCCFGKQLCVIPRDSTYYNYLDRYIYCEKCFNELHGSEIEIHDDPSNPGLKIKKESFTREKNDKLDPEPMVDCLDCGRRMHKICVLHLDQIWTSGFICSPCRQAMDQKRKENKYTAKRLPPTKLGSYLENRVNSLLKRKAAGAGDVAVRVLSSYDKVVEVKPAMKAKFVDNGLMSESFPYRVKSIFAFEEIDGTDVCFFGMHVQEYGSDCPPSNARRVYIAYLDSVNFFQPRHFRTLVYHELLIGYLDYVKSLGYQMAHIWACPPSEGDDYIFYCHPPEMKIPKPKRLQEWYRRMLDKAICDNVIFDYKDILKEFKDRKMKEVAELPYFEGDFWPNVFEENIKELNQELEKRQKEEEEATNDTDDGETNDGNSTELQSVAGKKKDQKSGQTKKKSSKTKKLSSRRSRMSDDLTERVLLSMEKHKEVFFVIRLQSTQPDDEMTNIKDPDPLMNNELLDGRDPFLTMSREKHLEFSSLRRAKFSTATLLYELHLQAKDNFIYTCNSCKASVETRYHCLVCEDFDLCVLCFRKTQHPHRMTKLGLDLDDDGSQVDAKPQNAQEARRLKMQSCVQVLEHSCICRDANCTLASCRNMRKALAFHPKECQRKTRSACAKCKQLFTLCCYHAKSCREKRCLVPFCQNIKMNLEKKRQNERFQQQRLIMRRTAMMNCVEDATNESSMPAPFVPAGPGYAGEKVPSLAPGTEVMFHTNVQPFGCSVGNEMYAPLSQCPNPTSPYDFMPSAQTYSPMGSSSGIGYNSLPGTSGIGHFGQPEVYGQPLGHQVKFDSAAAAAAADRTRPVLMANQMLPEKFTGFPGDKQKLIRVLKANPRLMAEFIKKVRLQEALKLQQQQQLMMSPVPGTAQTLSDGSVRYPMVPYPGQQIQQQGGMGATSGGRTMMATNGEHHVLQPHHQSTRLSPQRMPLRFDRHQQPGMTPCSQQPYPGINHECVGLLPFHQMAPHVNPQLMNHSTAQQPQGSTMNVGSYLLPPDKMLAPGALQMTDCSSAACLLPSASPLASSSSASSPCPANNSLSPHHHHHLPTHYKNQMLPHSADFNAVQRMCHVGPQQNALCQDAMFGRQLSFSPNAKTPEMANSTTLSRQTELTGSSLQQQQQFTGTNSFLHFLDRK